MNIEDRFKDAFDNYEVDPGNQLWSKIQSEIPSSPASSVAGQAATAGAKAGSAWLTTAIVGSAIILTSIAGYYYFESKAEARKEKAEKVLSADSQEQQVLETKPSHEPEILNESQTNSSPADEPIENEEPSINSQEKELEISNTKKAETNAPKSKVKQPSYINKKEENSTAENNSGSGTKSESQLDATAEKSSTSSPVNIKESETADNNVRSSSSNTQNESNIPANVNIEDEDDHDSKLDPNDPNGGKLETEPEVDHGILAVQQFKPMNIFSPDGDGINDVFMIDPDSLDALGVTAINVKIFSPSTGRMIHQWNDKYGYWDGRTASGVKAADGPYFYQMILVKDGKEIPKQGTITIAK